ncbi:MULTISPECIES: phospholipid scramblase-related protein [unclassified Streptomyces]|uniref:phospholipid scramblase-related protein n=1 Tax=unclassified Streptomyces TaxID=2593676 RepID=UPI0036E01414
MTTQSNTPAGWYPDPQGAPQTLRWWDGAQWTEHTSPVQQPAGQQVPQQAQQPQQQHVQQPAQGQFASHQPQQHAAGPYGQQAPQQQHQQQQYVDPAKVQRQVQHQAGVAPTAQGGGSLFTEPVLVVNQKAKLIELTNEYTVMDQNGAQIGSVVQVGQSTLKKVARFVSSLDQFMTHKLEIRDAYGQPQLVMTRPAKFMKSRVVVERPDGSPVGEIVQQNMIGKINFGINVNGQQIGAIKAENWRAWNFSIVDHADNEVARITKTWEGLAKTMFTTADNYVLQIHYQLPEPLLSLVVATALTVDTALKQDSRGFG